jgi:hypothetical protein
VNVAANLFSPPALDDATLSAALATAEASKRSPLEVLEESSALSPAQIVVALGQLLEYRVISADVLMQLEPAFDLLPPSEAKRRGCVLVHGEAGLVAVIANPFDATVRSWLEMLVSAPMEGAAQRKPNRRLHHAPRRTCARHGRAPADAPGGRLFRAKSKFLADLNQPDESPIVIWARRSTMRCAPEPVTFIWRPAQLDWWFAIASTACWKTLLP